MTYIDGPYDPNSGQHMAERYRQIVPKARITMLDDDVGHQQQAIDELLALLENEDDRPERVLAHLGRAELLALGKDYDASESAGSIVT